MKVNPNYPAINVSHDLASPNSIYYYYQKLILLRKKNPIIVYGTYDLILEDHEDIYAFTRSLQDERLLVMLNFTRNKPFFTLPPQLAFSENELLTLQPYEGRVYRLH
jgi:glycosidase